MPLSPEEGEAGLGVGDVRGLISHFERKGRGSQRRPASAGKRWPPQIGKESSSSSPSLAHKDSLTLRKKPPLPPRKDTVRQRVARLNLQTASVQNSSSAAVMSGLRRHNAVKSRLRHGLGRDKSPALTPTVARARENSNERRPNEPEVFATSMGNVSALRGRFEDETDGVSAGGFFGGKKIVVEDLPRPMQPPPSPPMRRTRPMQAPPSPPMSRPRPMQPPPAMQHRTALPLVPRKSSSTRSVDSVDSSSIGHRLGLPRPRANIKLKIDLPHRDRSLSAGQYEKRRGFWQSLESFQKRLASATLAVHVFTPEDEDR